MTADHSRSQSERGVASAGQISIADASPHLTGRGLVWIPPVQYSVYMYCKKVILEWPGLPFPPAGSRGGMNCGPSQSERGAESAGQTSLANAQVASPPLTGRGTRVDSAGSVYCRTSEY